MINYQDEVRHSSKNRTVRVRSFPGATTEDILSHNYTMRFIGYDSIQTR